MNPAFTRRDGSLFVEDVSVPELASITATPFYCYSLAALETAWQEYQSGLSGLDVAICYSIKANHHISVIRSFSRLGAWGDILSVGELRRAMAGGIPASQLIFAGVGKTDDEIAAALAEGVHQFNVESHGEMIRINAIAQAQSRVAPISIRINPDIDAQTHAKISTGRKGDKFGISLADIPGLFEQATSLAGIDLRGLAVHIGSQLLSLSPLRAAYQSLATLTRSLREAGYGIDRLDLGGGIGVDYSGDVPGQAPSIAEQAALIGDTVADLGCKLYVEPGRRLTAGAGILVTRVIETKRGPDRSFVIVDAAMNDFMRPALYGAVHPIWQAETHAEPGDNEPELLLTDIVGPICESSDTIAAGLRLPFLPPGSLLAIAMVGAYGSVMSSPYNARAFCAELLVDKDRHAVISKRIEPEEWMAREIIPHWMEK